jgi:hypothetical protein
MANLHELFLQFDEDLRIKSSKKERIMKSRDNLREKIRNYFKDNYPNYHPKFYIQGSYKMNTSIRTKDDTCDLDDGVYFKNNPDKVTSTTLQEWVKNAVDEVTVDVRHRKKCITVNYVADYNIDLPVYLFDQDLDEHPSLAVKNEGWRKDDPREMIDKFNDAKREKCQLIRIVRYLKAWSNSKGPNMPTGLAMTILAMDNFYQNSSDDVALKFTLIEIENTLKRSFQCKIPATPYDDVFENYDSIRKTFFMDNLSAFIIDAKKAVDEVRNQYKASQLWKGHLGDKFPNGEDVDEKSTEASAIIPIIGNSKPYCLG